MQGKYSWIKGLTVLDENFENKKTKLSLNIHVSSASSLKEEEYDTGGKKCIMHMIVWYLINNSY